VSKLNSLTILLKEADSPALGLVENQQSLMSFNQTELSLFWQHRNFGQVHVTGGFHVFG